MTYQSDSPRGDSKSEMSRRGTQDETNLHHPETSHMFLSLELHYDTWFHPQGRLTLIGFWDTKMAFHCTESTYFYAGNRLIPSTCVITFTACTCAIKLRIFLISQVSKHVLTNVPVAEMSDISVSVSSDSSVVT